MKPSRLIQLVSLFTILASAQIPFQANAQSEVDVNIRAIALKYSVRNISFENGSSIETFASISRDSRGKKVRYQGDPKIDFFRLDTSVENPNESAIPRAYLGSAVIPDTSGDFLLIVQPIGNSKDAYKMAFIRDDTTTFKAGTFRFINTASFDLAISSGGQRTMVAKGSFSDVIPTREGGNYIDTVIISMLEESEPFRSFRGGFPHKDDMRYLCIIGERSHGRRGNIEVKIIPERM